MAPLLDVLLVVAGVLVFAVVLHAVWGFTADDAFITFRHAANLIAGHGPSFDPDRPVEGATSMLWVLVSALPLVAGADVEVFTKVLGVAAALAAGGLAALLARALLQDGAPEDRRLAGSFAGAAFLALPATAVHAVSGMETTLAAALLTLALWLHTRARGAAAPPPAAVAVVWLLAGLARPELNAVALGVMGAEVIRVRRDPAPLRRWSRAVALGYLVPGAVYFVTRAAWFGHLLPLPYYAKVGGGPALPGGTQVLVFVQQLAAQFGIPLAAAAGVAGAAPVAWAAAAVVGLTALPDPVMNFDHRYALPALPALCALAGVGLARLRRAVQSAPNPGGRVRAVGTPLVLAATLAFTASAVDIAFRTVPDRRAYGESLRTTLVRFGQVLSAYRVESGRVPLIALGDVGAVGFRSGWRILDTHGLNEPHIALTGRLDPEWVLSREPDLVAVVSRDKRTFQAHWASRHDQGLYDACVSRGMRPALILAYSAASFTFVMGRPGSDVFRFLQHEYLGRPR